jgi:hypothetical protein
LGGPGIPVSDPAALAKAERYIHILSWDINYVYQCVYAAVLIVTAVLVAAILRGEQPEMRVDVMALREYPKRISGYSLKLWLLSLIFMVLYGLPAILHAVSTGRWSNVYTGVEYVVSLVCFGWFMAPLAIRLLRPLGSEPVSAAEKRLGRYSVIFAGIAVFALGRLLFLPLRQLSGIVLKRFGVTSAAGQVIIDDVLGPVLAFPNLMASIAIALIAAGGDWKVDTTIPSLIAIQKLLRRLMPLHSQPGNELPGSAPEGKSS